MMKNTYDDAAINVPGLQRFISAQERDFKTALAEINSGRKRTHWMWYIFPQIIGLGFSEISKFYSIKDLTVAEQYLLHPILGSRLLIISKALLKHKSLLAADILGTPDDMKLRSSMTLFTSVPDADPIFQEVLDEFFEGRPDTKTLKILDRQAFQL